MEQTVFSCTSCQEAEHTSLGADWVAGVVSLSSSRGSKKKGNFTSVANTHYTVLPVLACSVSQYLDPCRNVSDSRGNWWYESGMPLMQSCLPTKNTTGTNSSSQKSPSLPLQQVLCPRSSVCLLPLRVTLPPRVTTFFLMAFLPLTHTVPNS